MPTARFYRRNDRQWRHPQPGAWEDVARSTAYSEDDFIHHGHTGAGGLSASAALLRGAASQRPVAMLLAKRQAERRRLSVEPPPPPPPPLALVARHFNLSVLIQTFHEAAASPDAHVAAGHATGFLGSMGCPTAEPEPGTPAGWDEERRCCRHGGARRRNHSGPCWRAALLGPPPGSPSVAWACGMPERYAAGSDR